jgi:hypothetical protein
MDIDVEPVPAPPMLLATMAPVCDHQPPAEATCRQWYGLSQWRRLLADRFLEAASRGNIERLLALRAAGASSDAADTQGRRALHLASSGGHLTTVQWLCTDCSSVTVQDDRGLMPLNYATRAGHAAVEQWLRIQQAAEANRLNRDWDHHNRDYANSRVGHSTRVLYR